MQLVRMSMDPRAALMISIPAIKQAALLHEVVAEHVRLARRGKTLWGLCPFHKEKSASFAVHAEYFHCHGCHASGDVIDFTARVLSVSKGRAIRVLAERYGIPEGARQSRAESQYLRDLRAQAEYWWVAKRAAALTALENTSALFFADQTDRNEELAIRAGQHLRMVDGITPAIRGRVFLALRGRS